MKNQKAKKSGDKMSNGFGEKTLKVDINENEVDKLLKTYKKLKKYMKTPMYEAKKISGTEKIISGLLDKYGSE